MKHLPFLLTPAAKDYLWGGSRLNDDFSFDDESIMFGDQDNPPQGNADFSFSFRKLNH